jgi:hypothetical protein
VPAITTGFKRAKQFPTMAYPVAIVWMSTEGAARRSRGVCRYLISLIISITWTNWILEQQFLWQRENKGRLPWRRQAGVRCGRQTTHDRVIVSTQQTERAHVRIGGKDLAEICLIGWSKRMPTRGICHLWRQQAAVHHWDEIANPGKLLESGSRITERQ